MKTILFALAFYFTTINANTQEIKSVEEAKGLSIGVNAPGFQAVDAESITFTLSEALKEGPVVVIFYRGHWCPYCDKHLAAVQDSLKLITARGANVIAISPQKPDYLEKMAKKTSATFRLLYDEGYTIADAYDVTFTPEKKQLFTYNTMLNGKLKKAHSDDTQRLPIPATYIISQEGIIVWRQFDPNYKSRSTVKNIMDNLPQ